MNSRRPFTVVLPALLGSAILMGACFPEALAAPKKPPQKSTAARAASKRPIKPGPANRKARLNKAADNANVPKNEFISVAEITPGMKGYGLTVFKGTKIERFGVTVIDILRGGIGPTLGRDVIMIRTHGPVFDKRKAMSIGGMSGSPIFINGRLAGAYSYGAQTQNEPVAFVTPIADMLEAWSEKLPQKPLFASAGGAGLPGGGSPSAAAARLSERISGYAATPPAMTLGATGLSAPVLQRLNQSTSPLGIQFKQTMAVGKSVMADKAPPLQPGSTFGFALATGDIELGQSGGTVTYRKGNRILTLGHPGLGMLGPMEIPLTTSYVADVLSMQTNSTKLQSNGSTIGSLTQDTPYGTAGIVGKMPDLTGVTVNVTNEATGQNRTMKSRVMKHPLLTSRVIWAVADEAIFRMHTFPGDAMAEVTTRVISDGVKPITRTNFYYAPMFIDMFALQDLEDLLAILTRNEFGPVDVKHVSIDVKIQPGRKSLRIERAFVDKDKVEPGETVQVGVVLRPWRKEPYVKTISMKVPETAPNGRTQIVVTNGATPVNIAPAAPAPGTAVAGAPRPPVGPPTGPLYRNVQQMVDRYLELDSNSDLVTRLFLTSPGVNILGERLYDVPAPIGDVLRSPKSSGYRMERDSVKKTEDMDAFVMGAAVVPITIEKSSYQEQGRTTARPAPRAPSSSGSATTVTPPPPPSSSTSGELPDDFDSVEDLKTPSMAWDTVSPTLRALGMFPAREGYKVQEPNFLTPRPLTIRVERNGASPAPLVIPSAASDSDDEKKSDEAAKPVGTAKVSADAGESDETKTEEKKAEEKKTAKPSEPEDKTKGPGRTATLWTQKTKAQFERGDGKGVGVTTLGDIRLAPTLQRKDLLEQESQVWAMMPDGRGGYYLGTGSSGNIYPMSGDGKLGTPIKTDELAIRTFAAAPNGDLYAAGWPTGTIYRVTPDGTATPFAKTGARYVLSLVTDKDGNLYAAAGPGGRVLKITPSGAISNFFKTTQPHVLSLAMDTEGNLIVGTSDSGALYRVTPAGQSTVLFDPEDNAVTALLVNRKGEIFAGTSPKGRILNIKPNGGTRLVYEAGAPVMALAEEEDGSLYAGAGPMVIRVDPNEVVTRVDTEDQNQILDLMWTKETGLWAVSGNLAAIYQTETQKKTGEYLSPVHDSKNPARWGRISWQARVPKDGSVLLETRTGNTTDPDSTWSAWSGAYTDSDGSSVASPPGRFIQYRARLASGQDSESPELKSVTVSYLTENRPPIVNFTSPTVADVWSDKQTIRWSATDPDKDTLTYDLFYSADGGNTWKPIKREKTPEKPEAKSADDAKKTGTDLKATVGKPDTEIAETPESRELLNKIESELDKDSTISQEDRNLLDALLPSVVKDAVTASPSKEIKPDPAPAGAAAAAEKPITETSFSWDTKEIPDGEYFLKIVATDRRSNPGDPRADDKILGPITILNQKPSVEIQDRTAEVKDRAVTVKGMVFGGKAPISTVSYRVDKGEWHAAEATDGLFDSPTEPYRIVTDPLPSGERTIEVRATTIGNLNGSSSMKITVQ